MPLLKDLVPRDRHKKYGLAATPATVIRTHRSQQDILKYRSNIKLPYELGKRTCYVVSPGLWGRDHYGEIPEDAFVIIVNYAIKIPQWCRDNGVRELKPAIWLCADRNLLTHCKWFLDELDAIIDGEYPIDINAIKAGGPVIPVFDSGFLGSTIRCIKVVFHHGKSMRRREAKPIPGRLRAGLTISCQAVQLAFWLGAEQIKLCGIDMFSDDYFDSNKTNVPSRRNRVWPQTSHFNKYILWMQLQGLEIMSLSKTSLNVIQPID